MEKGSLYPYPKDIYETINPIGESVNCTVKLLKMSGGGVASTSISLFLLISCLCQFPLESSFLPSDLVTRTEAWRADKVSFSFLAWFS